MLKAKESWQDVASQLALPAASAIFHQGDMPRAVYFISSGLINMIRTEPDGRQLIVNQRPFNRWIGLASAIKQKSYDFTAVTRITCRLWRLPIQAFHQLLETDTEFSGRMLEALSDNYIELYARVSQIAHLPARRQLEQYLRSLLREQGLSETDHNVRLKLPLKRKEIAQMIAVVPSYVSDMFKELEGEGIISRESRSAILVIDPQRLWHESDFDEG